MRDDSQTSQSRDYRRPMLVRHSVPKTQRIRARGIDLHVTTMGRDAAHGSDAAAVVGLHGGPGVDGSGLRLGLAPLAEMAKVVVPDQRGHGLSDLASSETWELDEWADDLACIIDALSLERPTVAGFSFGEWVALRHAARHPEQIGSLLIAAMTARLPSVLEGARRMGRLGGPRSEAAWLAAHDHSGQESADDFRRHCLSLMSVRQPSPELAAVRRDQISTPRVNEHFTGQFTTQDLTPDVRGISCPLTVIIGELDPLTTPELAAATTEASPGPARLRVVPGAAHDLLVDAPEILLAEIGSSLADRRRR